MNEKEDFLLPRHRMSFLDESYVIKNNDTDRFVECTFVCRFKFDSINKPLEVLSYTEKNKLMRKYGMSEDGTFSVKAKATCHKNDKFDDVLGCHISQSRCKAKAYDKVARLLEDAYSYAMLRVSAIEQNIDFYSQLAEAEDSHIRDITRK